MRYTAAAVNSTAAPILETLLGSRLRAALLGWLFCHPDERFFVRQLAGLLGEDSTNVSRELARLSDLGLLTVSREGQQKYYQVDRSSAVYPELRGLVLKTAGLGDQLREALKPLSARIDLAFVYGSVASGKADAASDVDVLVIGEVTSSELVEVLGPLQNRIGREVNPAVYPLAEFQEKTAMGHRFLTSVIAGPKLFLIGTQNELEHLASLRLAG